MAAAASTEAEVGQEQGGQRRKRCVYGHSERKKELTRATGVATEGAPSILFNRDHFLGAVSLFFYLMRVHIVANPHDSHFPSL